MEDEEGKIDSRHVHSLLSWPLIVAGVNVTELVALGELLGSSIGPMEMLWADTPEARRAAAAPYAKRVSILLMFKDCSLKY